jgi:hypothetical protein
VAPPVLDFSERLAVRRARSHTPVQELARQLAVEAPDLSPPIVRKLIEAEPRLEDPRDPALAALAEHSVLSTVGAMLSALAYGVPADAAQPTDAATALFERLAERDDGLAVALRAQRLLLTELWELWAQFVDEHVADGNERARLLVTSTRQLAAYSDSVSECLARAWPEAQRRRRRGIDVPAGELVRRALVDAPEVAEDALEQLGHPLDAAHVAVALPPSLDPDAVEGLARRLKLACGTPALAGDGMIWVSFTRASATESVAGARPLLELDEPVGLGEPGHGLDGFRRTRRQSLDALRVAGLSDATGAVRYRDVALLAVLCADEARALELARVELGLLGGFDAVAVRLRETVRAYLAEGENQVATAQRLFIHQKTVKYRLRQAEELLGRKIGDRRSELAAALMVHRALIDQGSPSATCRS